MIRTINALLGGVLLASSLAAQAELQQLKPGINLDDLRPQNPAIRKIKERGLQPRLKLPPRASATGATLSVYAVPFETWCRNNPRGVTEGRISVTVSYPREADGSPIPATLVVFAGTSGSYSIPITLGAGTFSVSSGVIEFPATEICADQCVDYRLQPRGDTPPAWIDGTVRQACIP